LEKRGELHFDAARRIQELKRENRRDEALDMVHSFLVSGFKRDISLCCYEIWWDVTESYKKEGLIGV